METPFFLMNMGILPECVSVCHVCGAYEGQKRLLDILEFQTVLSHYMGVGN